jgi:hypothetical protein
MPLIHDQKLIIIADAGFRNKVAEAALQYAKGILLGTIVQPNANVKRFAQIVLKEIAQTNPSWLDGLCYFTLSTTTSEALTSAQILAAPQSAVTTEVNIVFVHYAKAHYGDIT